MFVTGYVFMVRSCYHLAQPPSWRTTPFRVSATAYSIYLQIPFILEAIPSSVTWGCSMLWYQGLTCHSEIGISDLILKVNFLCYHTCVVVIVIVIVDENI